MGQGVPVPTLTGSSQLWCATPPGRTAPSSARLPVSPGPPQSSFSSLRAPNVETAGRADVSGPAAGGEARSPPAATLLTLVPGLHAGDEGVTLVAPVVLVGVIQGHAHALVLVPLVAHIPALDRVLDPLLFCTKAARTTPT